MKQRKIALGPGAASLILIIVLLSMCVLCMLTYISAKNDLSLAERSCEMVETAYVLNARSEASLARLDAALAACDAADWDAYLAQAEENLPEGMRLEDDCVSWQETEGDRTLHCTVKIAPHGETPRLTWTQHALMVGMDDEEVEFFD